MGEDAATEWPDDADPFDAKTSNEEATEQSSAAVEEPLASIEAEDSGDELTPVPLEGAPSPEGVQWTLPVRAAPLLEQFHNESVTEYPLLQTSDGMKSTSLVLDEDLLRIIETRLDADGQRRMNVSLSMKRELTGFKHHHNELMHKHQYLWLGSAFLGAVLLLSNILVFTLLGLVFVSAGLWNWTKMHLETHRLEFANSGGVLTHTLRGYGTDRPFFRASMAYLGSEMAGLLRTGILETSAVEELHASLATPPPPPPAPVALPAPHPAAPLAIPEPAAQQQLGQPLAPSPLVATVPEPLPVPATPQIIPGPPIAPPLPSAPIPPPQNIPPPPIAGPPVAATLPTAPLPPPAPLPQIVGGMPMPPPLGIPGAPIPLDAPMPNAPEVAVTASPVEDTLSEEEQNSLLNELS
ncbi:hypothetical protein N9L41_02260 [Euryarchaeota archaeon]|nr:hypothetical protein [Euryarchaeota archaeon]MDA8700872.1 hypothetical protein [Euryarchaeota archaeon]MDA9828977.1 hypothetical protein [Candidatus Poseidoniaceae archaeon]MDB2593268.1 hypothetical protein [Euryarchaeota archaeon]